jgi:hypothetical protein
MYYALAGLAVGGAFVLRRRRVPVFPLVAVGLDVVATVLVSFGQTRYRTPVEVSLVLLAAVQLDWLWSKLRPAAAPADLVHGWSRGAHSVDRSSRGRVGPEPAAPIPAR